MVTQSPAIQQIDGRNMALLLQTLKSGMDTYLVIYDSLESKYRPFHEVDFNQAFRGALHES